MRPRLPMRWPLLLSILAMPGCINPPSIPAPWEATEPQAMEPSTTLPDPPASDIWSRIGSSVRGKQILATTIGTGPRRVYVIGGIHGDETDCPAVTSKLPDLLTESPALERTTIRIVRDMNPDGTSVKTRTNTRKVDLERNWPSKDFKKTPGPGGSGDRACSELETAAVHADIVKFNPEVIIVFQSANVPPTVTYLGPGRMQAYDFASAARGSDPHWRFSPDQRRRLEGSIESLFGSDMGKTVLRVEFQKNVAVDANAAAMAAGLRALDARPLTPEAPPAAKQTASRK